MNFSRFKIIAIAIVGLFIFSACISKDFQNKNKIQDKEDIKYYYGVLPCASCPGIETCLSLKQKGKKVKYLLKENYLEEKNGLFVTEGQSDWSKEKNVIYLSNPPRKILIKDKFAIFGDKYEETSLYKLKRIKNFKNNKCLLSK